MPRTLTSPMQAAIGAGVSQPAYLLEISWPTLVSRLCNHSEVEWAGQAWLAANFDVRFDRLGRPSEITIFDADAAYRTLALASGLTDRRIRLWQAYRDALASDDPLMLIDGYADGCRIGTGEVSFSVDYQTTEQQFSPRERIGPRTGVNFCGAVGETVRWGATVLKLEPR